MGKTESTSVRLRSLDGLRGVAAFVVLLSHLMLTAPLFARSVYSPDMVLPFSTWQWWATYTPLHLLWAGHEAVYVFFVLSGFVLTLPVISREGYSWREYYPKRLVRLYAPVAAAVAFGIGTVVAAPRTHADRLGAWLQDRPADVTLWGTFKDLTLVAGPSRLISPLWSLQWEIIFSLLLPAYIVFARRQQRATGLKVALIVAAIGVGAWTGEQALVFLPMFAAGALLATHRDAIANYVRFFRQGEWWALLVVAFVLATSRWTLTAVVPGQRTEDLATIPGFIGCAMLVVLAAYWDVARHFLESPVCRWLGTISFSLYLTHEPIVIALAFTFGPGMSWLVAVVAIPTALVIGWAFYKLVEGPSHKLAQRVGKAFAKKHAKPLETEAPTRRG